ncbi:MAG: hypothetical protein GTO67_08915 [Gammaproteobacteria bacterium]|nr:hypothetical protein [Gammaproteobacteria bacterium]NIO23908.1 hypothetical protein [Gammaproteobacteria bacterium]NIO64546.1 hypothetical protein [Gammaproteobacteria bacterium]NIP45250.1 hypothetical protein [Gammaproteobacteria bacterium]NIP87912.1 hypothetical protein [Gammaproteobacteria bacterium]
MNEYRWGHLSIFLTHRRAPGRHADDLKTAGNIPARRALPDSRNGKSLFGCRKNLQQGNEGGGQRPISL